MISEPEGRGDPDHRYELSPDEPPSEAVLAAVSAFSGDAVIPDGNVAGERALPPLYDAVDPDALDAVLQRESRSAGFDGRVSFEYHGYEVTVHSDGHLTLRQLVPELLG